MLNADFLKEIEANNAAGKVVDGEDGRQHVLIPPGWQTGDITPVNARLPDHVIQGVNFDNADSFVAYVNDFKTAASRLFVSVAGTKIVADLDYHEAPAKAAHRAHRAVYPMPVSEEWKRWTGIDGQSLPQIKFAEFLEENLEDVVEPAGAALLEVATTLAAKKKVEFKSGVRLANGDVQLVYDEQTEAGGRGQANVPTEIKLGIPVFFGGDRYSVRVFFRWRIGDDGKLSFGINMHRRQMILQDAVQSVAKDIGEKTGLVPLYGMPA